MLLNGIGLMLAPDYLAWKAHYTNILIDMHDAAGKPELADHWWDCVARLASCMWCP